MAIPFPSRKYKRADPVSEQSESEEDSEDFSEDDEEEETESDSQTHQPKEWKCCEKECEKSFQHKKSLINHRRQYHLGDENLECSHCGKRFSSKSNLRVHERLHNGQLPCKCQVEGCTASFRTAHFLKEHMKKYHEDGGKHEENEYEYECSYCFKKFKSERTKRTHMESHLVHNRILCPVCNKEFYNSETITRHIQRLHTGQKGQAIEKLLNLNQCSFCDKRFLSKRQVRDHCLLNHKNFKGFPCQVCQKYYINLKTLQGHIKSHKDAENPKFHCTECSAQFSTRSHYNEHLKRHSKSYTYKCPVCPNKGFFRQAKLDVHLNRYHRPSIDLRTERSRHRDIAKHKASMPELYPPRRPRKRSKKGKIVEKLISTHT